jgi:hypothetical protein
VEDEARKEAVRIRRYLAMAAEVRSALHSTEHFNVGPVIWFWFMFSNIRRQITESYEQASGSRGGGMLLTDYNSCGINLAHYGIRNLADPLLLIHTFWGAIAAFVPCPLVVFSVLPRWSGASKLSHSK